VGIILYPKKPEGVLPEWISSTPKSITLGGMIVMQTIIGVDVGGTLLRAARYDLDLNILDRVEQPTHAELGRDAVLERLYQTARQALPKPPDILVGIGVALPGPVDMDNGILIAPPNLPLKDCSIARLI
jgi:glucokinase